MTKQKQCLRFGEIAHGLLSLSYCHMFEASATVPDCRLISSCPRPSQISRANGERASGVAMKMEAWIQTRKHMNKNEKNMIIVPHHSTAFGVAEFETTPYLTA